MAFYELPDYSAKSPARSNTWKAQHPLYTPATLQYAATVLGYTPDLQIQEPNPIHAVIVSQLEPWTWAVRGEHVYLSRDGVLIEEGICQFVYPIEIHHRSLVFNGCTNSHESQQHGRWFGHPETTRNDQQPILCVPNVFAYHLGFQNAAAMFAHFHAIHCPYYGMWIAWTTPEYRDYPALLPLLWEPVHPAVQIGHLKRLALADTF